MTLQERFDAKYEIVEPGGCWVWMAGLSGYGYSRIHVGSRRDGSRRQENAHRVSWEIHKGPIPGGLFVLHRCDNKLCVNPDHLWLGTQADNVADMITKGRQRMCAGEAHGRVKITDAEVAEIRALAGTTTQRNIAMRFGVSRSHVGNILNRKFRRTP